MADNSKKPEKRRPKKSGRISRRKKTSESESSEKNNKFVRRSTRRLKGSGRQQKTGRRSTRGGVSRRSGRETQGEQTAPEKKSVFKENMGLIIGGTVVVLTIAALIIVPAVQLSSALSRLPDIPVNPELSLMENVNQEAYAEIKSFGFDARKSLTHIILENRPGSAQAAIVLGYLKDPKAIEPLKEVARNGEGLPRLFAIQALGRYGTDMLMQLSNLIKKAEDPEVKACIIKTFNSIDGDISDFYYVFSEALENSSDPRVLKEVLNAVRDRRITDSMSNVIDLMETGEGDIPDQAARVIAKLATKPVSMEKIKNIACSDDETRATRALTVFEHIGSSVCAPYIIKVAVFSKISKIRLKALEMIADESCKKAWKQAGEFVVNVKDIPIKLKAIETLGKMNEQRTWRYFSKLLTHPNKDVRKAAVVQLRDIRIDIYSYIDEMDQYPHGRLIEMLKDPELSIQKEAVETLRKMTGQYQLSQWQQDKWQKWWDDQVANLKLVSKAEELEKKGKEKCKDRKFGEGKRFLDEAENLYKKIIANAPGGWKKHFENKLQNVKVMQYMDMKHKVEDINK